MPSSSSHAQTDRRADDTQLIASAIATTRPGASAAISTFNMRLQGPIRHRGEPDSCPASGSDRLGEFDELGLDSPLGFSTNTNGRLER